MSVTVRGIEFTGDPCRVVTGMINGRPVTAGEAAMAHLIDTDDWLRRVHRCWLYVIQSAYHSGYEPSAGTHDYDKVFDVLVIRLKNGRHVWVRGQWWLRLRGWADWWRHTGTWYRPSTWHHHMASLTWLIDRCKVGIYVPGQIDDYCATPPRNGLSGHPRDRSRHPENIRATIFRFDKWMEDKDMPSPKDWDAEDWAAVQKRILDAPMNADPKRQNEFSAATVRSVLKDLWSKVVGK